MAFIQNFMMDNLPSGYKNNYSYRLYGHEPLSSVTSLNLIEQLLIIKVSKSAVLFVEG